MRAITAFSASLLFCVAVFAQSDRGTITGTIIDPVGAVIAAAAVDAKNIETRAVYQTVSSATGS